MNLIVSFFKIIRVFDQVNPLKNWCGLILSLLVLTGSALANEPIGECKNSTEQLDSMEMGLITLLNDHGKPIQLEVKIADQVWERAAGFQHICSDVIERTQILFAYQSELVGKFHMANVHAPLDIAFFNAKGHLVYLTLMETYTETSRPVYGPAKFYQYALEARAGFFGEQGVTSSNSRLLIP